jgi:hypothetical protein
LQLPQQRVGNIGLTGQRMNHGVLFCQRATDPQHRNFETFLVIAFFGVGKPVTMIGRDDDQSVMPPGFCFCFGDKIPQTLVSIMTGVKKQRNFIIPFQKRRIQRNVKRFMAAQRKHDAEKWTLGGIKLGQQTVKNLVIMNTPFGSVQFRIECIIVGDVIKAPCREV